MQFISLILLAVTFVCAAYDSDRIIFPDELTSDVDEKNDKFDWSLTKVILNNKCADCNVITSPYTVKLLLSLLDEGIREETESKKELSVLFSNLRKDEKMFYWIKTLKSLNERKNDYYVLMASLMCLSKSTTVDNFYKNMANDVFNTQTETRDFSQEVETAKFLNDYVSNKTEGNVKNIVSPDVLKSAVAIILNTIYFKADWELEFPDTFNNTFSVNRKTEIPVTYMEIKNNLFHYGKSEKLNAQLVRIGYKGGKYAMTIILPNEIDGLQHVIDNLDSSTIRSEQTKMQKTHMDVILPMFKFESSLSLKEELPKLGIKQIFTENSNIYTIKSTNPLEVSNIIQKMGINVNQKGTVAYGVIETSIGFKFGGSFVFKADHPFLFFIEDETTGAILFTGKVLKPKY